jgi:multidrug efflux pump subunit AcrA (membrane-fusion protein)
VEHHVTGQDDVQDSGATAPVLPAPETRAFLHEPNALEPGIQPKRKSLVARLFPEKRIFVKASDGTRFFRIGPRQQMLAGAGAIALVAWSVTATSFLVIELVQGGGADDSALHEKMAYEERVQDLAAERDAQRLAALDAQSGYDAALSELAVYQERLLKSELRARDLEQGRAALQRILQGAIADRDAAQASVAAIASQDGMNDIAALENRRREAEGTVDFLLRTLGDTANAKVAAVDDATDALDRLASLEHELSLKREANERIFEQLEDAVTLAMEPLGKMFENVGMAPESILRQMRRQYSGMGGPLTPISMSTKGTPPDAESLRASAILEQMDTLNLYRIAADKVPFAQPVHASVRRTSGFGYRRDPIRGGSRLHAGMDWAGAYGTPIYASADGVVTHSGWQSGYGRLIKIQHEFGIETRFAHLSRLNVKVGQRVSRGDLIGGMGNSGRSTGTHLHYEVRQNGTPVNPMTYIKAAIDVF